MPMHSEAARICQRSDPAADLFDLLTALIADGTGSLARRLAGSLALAAATVLCALAQTSGLQGLDVVHNDTSVQ